MGSTAHITECGIPGINSVPFGVHLCHFYAGRQDLVEALVPYFQAGLRNNERCIWLTAAPLGTADAKAAMMKAVPGLEAILERGALRILDFWEWYTPGPDHLNPDGIMNAWLEEERAALAAGYAGLRITGNTSFVPDGSWDDFMEYEHAVSAAFRGRRIVTLCSYGLHPHEAVKTLDAMRSHHCTLHRTDSHWQVVTLRE